MKKIKYASILLSLFSISNLNAQDFVILAEDFPPFQYEKDGELKGSSTAVVKEILKEMGQDDSNISIESWSIAYDLTQNEDGHILYSMFRTPEREELFKWVGPITVESNSFYKKSGSTIEITSFDDAKLLSTIGVGKAQASQILLETEGFENLEVYEEESYIYQELIDGNVELIPSDNTVFPFRLKELGIELSEIEKTDIELYENELYIAFSKSTSDDIITNWQNTLDNMKATNHYNEVYKNGLMEAYKDFDIKIEMDKPKPNPEDTPEKIKEEIVEAPEGWGLFGSSMPIEDISILTDNECVNIVWKYENGEWSSSSENLTSISKNIGFWIKTNESCTLKLH